MDNKGMEIGEEGEEQSKVINIRQSEYPLVYPMNHGLHGPPTVLPPLKLQAPLPRRLTWDKTFSVDTLGEDERPDSIRESPTAITTIPSNPGPSATDEKSAEDSKNKGSKSKHQRQNKTSKTSYNQENSVQDGAVIMDRDTHERGQLEGGSAFPASAEPPVAEGSALAHGTWAHSPESQRENESSASGSAPLTFCRLIAAHPGKAFGMGLACHLGMLALTLILQMSGYDILPMEFTDVPLDLTDDVDFLRGEAWVNRNQDPAILSRQATQNNVPNRSVAYETVELYYSLEDRGGNVFHPDNLRAIMKAEQEIKDLAGMADFCYSLTGDDCAPPVSVINFFDGSYAPLNAVFNDPEFKQVVSVLSEADLNDHTKTAAQYHFGKDSIVNKSQDIATSSITRTLFMFGLPLHGYASVNDKEKEQEEKLKQFIMDKLRPKLYEFSSNGVNGMDFFFNGLMLYTEDVNAQVIKDLSLAVGSFSFIFLFMWFQVRSLFITAFGLLSIITSFCAANMLYRIAFDYKYFGIFHVLSIFIILGIGADDIFVFYDTWRLSEQGGHPTLAHRLSTSFRKAASAMFVTSLTTMIAFFASALSPLLAVSSFGLFSGLLVFTNYLSVITYFPTVVTLYHVKFESWTWPCCRPCSNKPISPTSTEKTPQSEDKNDKKTNMVVHFFQTTFFSIVTHKWLRWIILVAFAMLLGVFIYFATTLKPDEEFVRIFKDNHNYGKANLKRVKSFRPSVADQNIRVYVVWGLAPQNRSVCHKTDFTENQCQGHTVWDPAFDLNPAPAQMALLKFCETLQTLSPEEGDRLKIRRDPVTDKYEIKCFMENLQQYFKKESGMSLPVTQTKMRDFMAGTPSIYNMAFIDENYYRYFEVAVGHWLTDGYSGTLTHDFESFTDLIGESDDPWDKRRINNTDIFYGTRLRYVSITVNTTLPYGNIGYETGIATAHAWEDFVNTQIAKMPPSLSGGFQCTPEQRNSWHWLKVQKALVDSAWTGVILGICLSFPILVLATQNLVLGFMATLTILSITWTVIGIIPLAGWKLGVLESLNLSLVVGLAVDYVVHLAEGYHASHEKQRLGRTRDMLKNVGISVISGATTTLGASLFMLFAQILFFMQFGIFMFCTIGFSLLFALGLFTTVLGLIGPQNDVGSIKPFFSFIRNLLKGRKQTDVNCKRCDGKGFHASQTQRQ